MNSKPPAKSVELTQDQIKDLVNTLVVHDEHGDTYVNTPMNWAFVDLDEGDLDDLPLDDYENDEEVNRLMDRIPEEMQDLPDNAFDSVLDGLKAAVVSHKLMVLYFSDDDFVEIDPQSASELIDAGAEKINGLTTKEALLDFIDEVIQ